MPKEIVASVSKRCEAGELKAWEKALMKKEDLDCHGLGEAIASMVENKWKKNTTDNLLSILNDEKLFTTHEYRDAGDFEKDSLHLRLIDAEKGVFAVVGKLNHLGKWVDYKGEELALSYKFAKDEWSEEDIKAYVKESIYKADTVKIKKLQLMKVGKWNGDDYTEKDFKDMIEAFEDGVYTAGMKFGHNRSQSALKTFLDGAPRFGNLERLYTEGESLYADYKDVPRKLAMLLEAGAFPIKSAEIYWNMKHNDKVYPKVLKAIAFFGDNVPAVKGLDDVINLYEPEEKVASGVDKQDVRVYNLDMEQKDYAKHTKAWHRCVEKVAERGDIDSPEAVCTWSLGRSDNVYLKEDKEPDEKNLKSVLISREEMKFVSPSLADTMAEEGCLGLIIHNDNDFEIEKVYPKEVKQMTAEEKAKFDETMKQNEELTKKLKEKEESEAKILKEKAEGESALKKIKDEAMEGELKAKVESLLKTKLIPESVNALVSLYKAVVDRKEKTYSLKDGKIEAGEEKDLKTVLDEFIASMPDNPEIVKKFTESAKSGDNKSEDKHLTEASEESVEMAKAVDKYLTDNKLPATAKNMSIARKAIANK